MPHQNFAEFIDEMNLAAEELLACKEEDKDAFLRSCRAYEKALAFPDGSNAEQNAMLTQARLRLADAQYRYATRMQCVAAPRTK